MDNQVSKSAEQVADAVSEERRQLDAIETARAIGYRDGHIDGRNEARAQTASAASPVAGVSGLDAEISEAKKEFIATFDAYREAQKVWRHLVKRMYYECGATKADEFIRRVESGEHDVPSPWLAQPSAEGDGWIAVTVEPVLDREWPDGRYAELLIAHKNGVCSGSCSKFNSNLAEPGAWASTEGGPLYGVTHYRPLPTPPSVQEEKGSSE